MYQVGQELLNGQVVVVSVDSEGKVLTVSVPANKDQFGNPLTITYSAGVTEMFVANFLAGI